MKDSGMMMRFIGSHIMLGTVLLAGVVLSGCSEGRRVGSIMEPYCAPDGSVVMYQKPNTQGSYDSAQASPENCP